MSSTPPPSPLLLFETLNAYQRTAALKAAIDLDVFTAIGEGANTKEALAARSGAAERGLRILCDSLVILGFLKKSGGRYALTADSAAFLDRRSPMCIASTADFLASTEVRRAFDTLTEAVRQGRTTWPGAGSVEPRNPIWVEFARSMASLQGLPSELIADIVAQAGAPRKILDIAAGHGLFGIALLRRNLHAEVVALDWDIVLEVAHENAVEAGVADRLTRLPGDAFSVDFGSGYDTILLTNFLHHFSPSDIAKLLKKVRAALAPGGRGVALEFVPNEDRVTPPAAASFSLTMLGTTRDGDAYTVSEYQRFFADAGFSRCEVQPLPPTIQQVVIATA